VTDHFFAFRPIFSGIKGGRELNAQEFSLFGFFGRVECPERIHHSSHKAFSLLNGHALEFGRDFGGPSGLSGVDSGHEFFVVEFGIFDGKVAETRAVGLVVVEKVAGQGELLSQLIALHIGYLSRRIGLAKTANEVSFGE
jgi:hypothetical protein